MVSSTTMETLSQFHAKQSHNKTVSACIYVINKPTKATLTANKAYGHFLNNTILSYELKHQ